MVSRRWRRTACFLMVLMLPGVSTHAQGRITTPKEQFGANIGDDYFLATYTQLVSYWQKLDQASDRMALVDIGQTAEGRSTYMAIVTSPENHRNLDRYKETVRKLALADGVSEDEARTLSAGGKSVVWIDGGLHATEAVGAQSLIEMVYQMVSRTDSETLRFLNDTILLCVPANPDGMELVSGWYMRNPDPAKRAMANLPRLYQKYAGHDDNRDSYMVNLAETENMNRVLFKEWFPQIMYNHHQTGPAGTVVFMPPFRDPFNYHFDPLIPMGIELVGSAMHSRFLQEGKPGTIMRSGAGYSTWWNGGLRTTVYFHNMIGLLTEIIGNPTPMEIPFIPQRMLPTGDYPLPIQPQRWRMRQSIEYEITANRAVLDIASRYRDTLLFNAWRMGKNQIERGSQDTWTVTPKRVSALQTLIAKEMLPPPAADGAVSRGGLRGVPLKYYEQLRNKADRDPRGYILPSDQPDFLTATKFVNALVKNAVTVHRATTTFHVGGKAYPAGSYIVKTAQPFRAHVMDMFEPQDHPDDFAYPGGPPRPPYDSAGWTLAFQMAVQFDRILEPFDGPFEVVPDVLKPPGGAVVETKGRKAAGYLLSPQVNDSFRAANRLLAAKEDVYRLKTAVTDAGTTYAAGTFYVAARPSAAPLVKKLADEIGLVFTATAMKVPGDAVRLRPVRIGLWDRYGGSMPSGWMRLIFERFEFPFEVVYAPMLDGGGLASKYDVLIFADGAIPAGDGRGPDAFMGGLPDPADIPAEYRGWLGSVTISKTVPQLRQFVEDGGTLVAIGSSTSIARHFGLPIANGLVERSSRGEEKPLTSEKFYVPGSVLQAAVDNTNPLAWGLGDKVDLFFENSETYRLEPSAAMKGVKPVAWFDSATPLRSGWAWGQSYLNGTVTIVDATVGRGHVFLFGPEVTFRAQPHGTFKFLFNGIYYGGGGRASAAVTAPKTRRQ